MKRIIEYIKTKLTNNSKKNEVVDIYNIDITSTMDAISEVGSSVVIEWLNFFRKKISNDNVVTDEDLLNTKRALQNITVVSKKLNEENFCRMFDSALKVFNLDISNEEKAKLILSRSQVFGGMCSWNDTPGYTAYKFGIKKEYEEVTEDLFR